MINTTPASILAYFEALLPLLDPSGGETVGTESAYQLLPETFTENPDEIAAAGLDRGFAIDIVSSSIEYVGGKTSNLVNGEMLIGIGHQIGDYRASRDRRLKDMLQIVTQLSRPTIWNLAGVCWVRFIDAKTDVVADGLFWWTTIRFRLQYIANVNYGGT